MELPSTPDELMERESTSTGWKELLRDQEKYKNIPLLNYTPMHKLKDETLVRFRGMVQDMIDPEMYLESYEVKAANGSTRMQQGKYRDCLRLHHGETVDYSAESNVHSTRRTLFVVSIPGLNEWVKEHEKQCNVEPHMDSSLTSGVARKRAADEGDNIEMDVDIPSEACKRQCTTQLKDVSSSGEQTAPVLSTEYFLNSPLPSRPSMACMVKIYEDFDAIPLNTIVDFVGFLSVNPALDATTLDVNNDIENMQELQALNPPPSIIPRLHAFGLRLLSHANPLLDLSLLQPTDIHLNIPPKSQETVHKEMRILFKLCLFDDDLAAEYLISHLISTVYSRAQMQSIGKFSLNICNLPTEGLQEYTIKLYKIMELLLPASHYIPMTLDTMNTSAFAPIKDYDTNKLVSGMLQLAPHTHLVLDETRMQPGKLESSGVLGMQHLSHLIKNQQLKCDFKFFHLDYNVDIPVMILSEGRSMLPCDFCLPVNADAKSVEMFEESFKAALHYLNPDRLLQFRNYLTQARISQFNVSDDHTTMIQEDFVEMRKSNAKSNADDLHGLLVLSRLLGIARGKADLDKETWQLATEFETKRRQRLQALPKSSAQTHT
ncbi:mini-chromosome maintenance complex-binding protein isoform X2 [Scaptodrosophila lebanonensis]|nr:mini-chromosome maintenance complex-binding protein isoform X2 [Scaptodrosophila lebanonensis]